MSEPVEFNFQKQLEAIVSAYQNGLVTRKHMEDYLSSYYTHQTCDNSNVYYIPVIRADTGGASWSATEPITFSYSPTYEVSSTTEMDYNQFLSEEIKMKISEDVSKAIKKRVVSEFNSQMSSMKSELDGLKKQIENEKLQLDSLRFEKEKIAKQVNEFTEHLNEILESINQAADKYAQRVARFKLLDI